MKYKIVAVIWQDHVHVNRDVLHKNPEAALILPTITIGALIQKTPKVLVVLSDIERYSDRDEGSYMVILRSSIVSMKKYGEIAIENIRFAP